MARLYDHIDLRVPSLQAARAFYETFLPALGFDRDDSSDRWLEFERSTGDGVSEYVAVTESPDHRPNENRIAFWADSPGEVDRIARAVTESGGRRVEGPAYEADFYYAVFFEDPAGNRFEVCYRTRN